MPENFAAGKFLRKADKCFGVCTAQLISLWVQSFIRTETVAKKKQTACKNIRVEKEAGKVT
jgi:hypothetical protein